MFTVRFSKSAVKVLLKMPRNVAASLQSELVKVAMDPGAYRGDWKPLQGSACWRLRKGGYRAICELRNNELLILVLKIGARGDVYK